MLFKNLKSGNLVSATDETSIELMEASNTYAAVYAVETASDRPKKAKRATKAKAENAE